MSHRHKLDGLPYDYNCILSSGSRSNKRLRDSTTTVNCLWHRTNLRNKVNYNSNELSNSGSIDIQNIGDYNFGGSYLNLVKFGSRIHENQPSHISSS